MELHKPYNLAPDPLTEPEKCTGLRRGFALISVLGLVIFICAMLALCMPSIYSFLQSLVDLVWTPAADPLALQHGSGPPIFR